MSDLNQIRSKFAIEAGTVQVLRSNTQLEKSEFYECREFLSPDEITRSNDFRFYKDASTFVSTRWLLRHILGLHLDRSPSEIVFGYKAKGKPYLPDAPSLKFNVSHSGGFALLAFVSDLEIGVDVEFIHRTVEYDMLAKQFFSSGEARKLTALEGEQKKIGFFNCWTRKEAFIKATGDGLSFPLDQFEVSFLPGEKPALLNTFWDDTEKEKWFLHSFAPAEEYIGAIAVKGKVDDIKILNYDHQTQPS